MGKKEPPDFTARGQTKLPSLTEQGRLREVKPGALSAAHN